MGHCSPPAKSSNLWGAPNPACWIRSSAQSQCTGLDRGREATAGPSPVVGGQERVVPGPQDPVPTREGQKGEVAGPQDPIPMHRGQQGQCWVPGTESQHTGDGIGGGGPPGPNPSAGAGKSQYWPQNPVQLTDRPCTTYPACGAKRLSTPDLHPTAATLQHGCHK